MNPHREDRAGRPAPPDWRRRDVPIESLGLSLRARKIIIQRMGLETLGDLCETTAERLLENKCFGETSLAEVREHLARYGLALKGEGVAPPPDPFADFKTFLASPRENLHLPLSVLDLCPDIADRLRGVGFVTAADVILANRRDLRLLYGFTREQVLELEERLELYGLALQPPPAEEDVAAERLTLVEMPTG